MSEMQSRTLLQAVSQLVVAEVSSGWHSTWHHPKLQCPSCPHTSDHVHIHCSVTVSSPLSGSQRHSAALSGSTLSASKMLHQFFCMQEYFM